MKICILAPASVIHTVRWVNALVERGHNVILLTMHKPKLDKINSRVQVHHLKIPAPFGYYVNSLEVKILLRKIQPDIVNVHYASGYGTLARLVDFAPTLLSVWGSDVYLFPYQGKRNEKMLKKNLESVHQITSTSRGMKEQTERFVNPVSPIEVIPFGIDITHFQSSGTGNSENFIFGTVKRLEEVYGIDILINAMAKLIERLHDNGERDIAEKIRLEIVGDGSELENLQRLTDELQLTSITEFVGAVANEDVPDHLNKFDIYCAFSRSESFGVAVLEASACEVPVVVSNVGGLPEVVQNGKTGFVVNYKDIDTIVERLYELVTTQEKRISFGKNGRLFVERYFDWEQNVSQMEIAFEKLIQKCKHQ